MTVFGFLATIFICGTVCFCCWWTSKKPITFRFIRSTEVKSNKESVVTKEENVSHETNPKEKPVDLVSMDAVISAANELMGIETLDREDK